MIRFIRAVAFEARFDVSPADVWHALTNAEALASWFAPLVKADQHLGGTVELAWDPEMKWPTTIEIWDPERHLRWADPASPSPDGTPQPRLFCDWSISTENGQTVLRLVHSGFGEGASWDEQVDGVTGGWGFFLWNLEVLLTRHRGATRTMVSVRRKSTVKREVLWSSIFESGFVSPAPSEDEHTTITLGDRAFDAIVRTSKDRSLFAARIPSLNDALLLIELEGAADVGFHAGFWISTYGLPAAETEALQQALAETVEKLLTEPVTATL